MTGIAKAGRAWPAADARRRALVGRDPQRRRTASLTDKVYESLRSEILSCALEPGRAICEAELAERFRVSKTPVREALANLRAEGFVRTFPRRGYQVVPVTLADLNDLFDVRAIYEAGAAELACRRLSPADLDRLQALADVTYDPGARTSMKRFVRANHEFHAAIARASGSQRLAAVVERTLDELERFFFLGARLRDINAETRDDHRDIVDVLRAGDPVAARDMVVRHNEVTRLGLFEALSSSAGLTAARR